MFEGRKAEKALESLKPELKSLKEQLAKVETIHDPVDRLVNFFDVVAPWYDKEHGSEAPVRAVVLALEQANRNGRYTAAIEVLRSLESHFENAGRSPYGLNRTQPGEPVSSEKVFLGNVAGRWTFPAREWKAVFNKTDSPTAKEDRQIIEGQASGFVSSHIGPMHQLIGSLAP